MKPKPAPATPAATPLREANQQRVDAAAQRVRQDLEKYYPAGDPFRKDVELLIEIALAPVLEIFAAAQPTATPLAIEAISAKVHEQWMETKRNAGVTSRKSESGEELMVPYEQLSEAAKELDRGSVRAVSHAIRSLEREPAPAQPQRESEPNVAAMREALEFAKGAIMDAIRLEDGLDGAAGTAVIGMIDKALTA